MNLYVNENGLLQISAKKLKILQEVALIKDRAMLSIKNMFDSLFRVDLLQNFISILSQACSKEHNFKDLRHLKQEDIQSESLCYVYLFQ